jgi:2-methylcitrate dehydratase PrpD
VPTDTTDPATDNIATQLAAFAHGLKPGMLPAVVVEQAKLLMLDALGIALASSQHDFAHCAYRGLRALGGAGDSAVMGAFAPLPLRDAVLMNGILVHGLDFDDTHPGAITHPQCQRLSVGAGSGSATACHGARDDHGLCARD